MREESVAPGSREVEFQPQTALGQADAAWEPGVGVAGSGLAVCSASLQILLPEELPS